MAGLADGKAGDYSSDALDESLEELARSASMLFSVAENHLSEDATEEAEKAAVEALQLFRELGDKAGVADTLRILVGVHRLRGDRQTAENLAKGELERFEESGDIAGEAAMLLTLTELESELLTPAELERDRYWRGTEACDVALKTGREAQRIFLDLGDKKMQAATLLALAGVYRDINRAKDMMQAANDALVLYRAMVDTRGEAKALHSVSVAYSMTEKWQDALKVSKMARATFQDLGLVSLEAAELFFMGQYSAMLKEHKQMLQNGEEAMELFQKIDSLSGECAALGLVVQAHGLLEDDEAGMSAAERALSRFQDAGYKKGEAIALDALASSYSKMGDSDKAATYAKDALELIQDLGDRRWEATVLYALAKMELDVGKYDDAMGTVQLAISISKSMGDMAEVANGLLNTFVQACIAKQDWGQAFESTEEARRTFESLGNFGGMAVGRFTVGRMCVLVGSLDDAESSMKDAQRLYQEAGDASMVVHCLAEQSSIYISKKNPEEAVRAIQEAHMIAQKEKDKVLEANVLLYAVQAHFASLSKLAEEGGSRDSRAFTDAINKAEKAATLASKIVDKLEDKGLKGNVAYTMAEVNLIGSKLEEAFESIEESVKLYSAEGPQLAEGTALALKGRILQFMGKLNESVAASEAALELARAVGDQALEAQAQAQVEAIKGKPGQAQMIQQVQEEQLQVVEEVANSAIEPEKPKGLDPLIVGDMLHGMLREMVGVQMESDTPFMDAGVDSLMSIEFRSQVNQAFAGLSLASTLTFDYPTIRELTSHIVEKSESE